MTRIASFCYRHRLVVVLCWIALTITSIGLAKQYGGPAATELGTGSSQSSRALALYKQHFPRQAADTLTLAVHADRRLDDPAVRTAVLRTVDRLEAADHVASVVTPYQNPRQLSADGRTGYAVATLDVSANKMPAATIKDLLKALPTGNGVQFALGGTAVDAVETPGGGPADAVGLVVAAVVLLLTFGSVLAMGLPIVTALFGIAVGLSGLSLLQNAFPAPSFAPILATMIGLGVGIDYALIIVTRYREALATGRTPHDAVVLAASTAGRSVLFAGGTVVIALCGLLLLGLDFMRGVGLGSAVTVAMTMAAATTLLPALLGFTGRRLAVRRKSSKVPWSARWAGVIARRPMLATVVSAAALLVLASPTLSLRFGMPDASTQPHDTSGYAAQKIITDGFGPGATSTLLVTVKLPGADPAAVGAEVAHTAGVASVSPAQVSPDGSIAVLAVQPTTGSQDPGTTDLVQRLRAVDPHILVGGAAAAAVDFAQLTANRLPFIILVVVGLSLVLLVGIFRSVTLALKAGLMNLLSIGAAFGVLVAVLQWGWMHRALNFPTTMPVTAWVPMIMFPVLFGISMDYEVFLISRIRESYVAGGSTRAAVQDGLSRTARVITAGAAIMIAVFLSVMLGADVGVKQLGFGLAVAVFVDATIVRLVLVPASMELLGRLNWWIPRWLDRLLSARQGAMLDLDTVSRS
ncbi:MMPL family transporter [Kribbella sp. NPDC059898]|uniref:MMPL family transporter n=1 Tax=Kribbella sp. NPDC059898 TaxID=3346995 RepID=UPI0036502174